MQTRELHLQLIPMKQQVLLSTPLSRSYNSLGLVVLATFHQVVYKGTLITITRTTNMYCESIRASCFSKGFICISSFSLCNNSEVGHVIIPILHIKKLEHQAIEMLGQTAVAWGFQFSPQRLQSLYS